MDITKILKRAWNIVWNYRTLWIFGFILAITAGGAGSGGGGNSGSRYNFSNNERQEMRPFDGFNVEGMDRDFDNAGEAFEYFTEYGIPQIERQLQFEQGDLTTLFWIIIAFIGVMFLVGLLTTAIRYVAETTVIRMVDEYEASETKHSFREGWRLGWNRRAWKLFLINLILNIPTFLLLLFFLLLGISTFQAANAAGGNDAFWVGMVGIIALVIGILLVFAILMTLLNLLRHFFWRKAALEELGVRDSLREGWQLFKENWKNIGLMWLVMVGIGFVWGIASIILALVTLPVVAITVVVGVVVAAIPVALIAAFFSLFLSSYLPWIAGALFVLPIFVTIAFSPWIFISGLWKTYASSVWTLVYREITTAPVALADETPALNPDADESIIALDA